MVIIEVATVHWSDRSILRIAAVIQSQSRGCLVESLENGNSPCTDARSATHQGLGDEPFKPRVAASIDGLVQDKRPIESALRI